MSAPSHVNEFTLFVPGPAHGQARTGGNGRIRYTPPKTRAHAQKVQTEWIAAGRPHLPDLPYSLRLTSVRRRPASHLNSKGEVNAIGRRQYVPGKPDLDNEVKQVLDALCAVSAIPDDRLLVAIRARKEWGWGAAEGVTVEFAVVPDEWGES